jgi:fatty-acyl-CoA synthase
LQIARKVAARAEQYATEVMVLGKAGIIRPYPPQVLFRMGKTLLQWGTGPAGGFATLALRYPHRVGLIDELGELTFLEMHERSNALADSMRRHGVREGHGVAIMCRNHRGFVDASIAAAKLGADVIYLNTAFAGPQLADVLEREAPAVVVHDEEFSELLAARANDEAERILAWTDSDDPGHPTLERLIAEGSTADHTPPEKPSRVIILTSGTTGTPKGAPRSEAGI